MSTGSSRGEEPFPAGTSWDGEARALLERAIHRHGGWSTWRAAAGISLVPRCVTGPLPTMKGIGRTFPLPSRIDVWPRAAVAVFHDYPSGGSRGVFRCGRVQLLDERGNVARDVAEPRGSFRGWRKVLRWSPLDALYFFGYALTHYHALPFTLVDGRPMRLRSGRVRGVPVVGLQVQLPPALHTHCAIQTFYFDRQGLLRRHDYVAEVVGAWARGAHLWEDFVNVGGLPIARRRRVVARLGPFASPFVVLHAEFGEVAACPDVSMCPDVSI